MPTFHVTWEIDVDIEDDSHEAAAREALRLVQKPGTTANVFDVIREDDADIVRIDLQEIDEERAALAT